MEAWHIVLIILGYALGVLSGMYLAVRFRMRM